MQVPSHDIAPAPGPHAGASDVASGPELEATSLRYEGPFAAALFEGTSRGRTDIERSDRLAASAQQALDSIAGVRKDDVVLVYRVQGTNARSLVAYAQSKGCKVLVAYAGSVAGGQFAPPWAFEVARAPGAVSSEKDRVAPETAATLVMIPPWIPPVRAHGRFNGRFHARGPAIARLASSLTNPEANDAG